MNNVESRIKTDLVIGKQGAFTIFFCKDAHYYIGDNRDCMRSVRLNKGPALLITMRWDNTFGFLGGTFDEGDTVETCSTREIFEESGFVSDTIKFNHFCSHQLDSGFVTHCSAYEVDFKTLLSIKSTMADREARTLDNLSKIHAQHCLSIKNEKVPGGIPTAEMHYVSENLGSVLIYLAKLEDIANFMQSAMADSVKEELIVFFAEILGFERSYVEQFADKELIKRSGAIFE